MHVSGNRVMGGGKGEQKKYSAPGELFGEEGGDRGE